jgi:two-component sensor histidine kinase
MQIAFTYFTYVTYLVIFLIVAIRDYWTHTFVDCYFEVAAWMVSAIALIFFHRTRRLLTAKIIAVWIAYFLIFALVYTSRFDHFVGMYVVIAPLIAYFMFTLPIALWNLALFYTLFAIETWMIPTQHSQFLQDPDAVWNFGITILFIHALGLTYHLAIKSSYRRLESSNDQNKMLLKEVHHRVKNNLNMIVSLIGLQIITQPDKEHNELAEIKNRIEAIAFTHELLYQEDSFQKIDFSEYMHKLIQLFNTPYRRDNAIRIHIRSDRIALPIESMIQIGLLTNELLTNTYKHAFDHARGEIHITLEKHLDSQLHYTYRDNGKGIDPIKLNRAKSLGMIVIRSTSQQLGGNPDIQCDHGFCLDLIFPEPSTGKGGFFSRHASLHKTPVSPPPLNRV